MTTGGYDPNQNPEGGKQFPPQDPYGQQGTPPPGSYPPSRRPPARRKLPAPAGRKLPASSGWQLPAASAGWKLSPSRWQLPTAWWIPASSRGGNFPPPPANDYGAGFGGPQLSVGAALNYGWERFKNNALTWIGITVVAA